jgi:hypothetical protein
MNKKKFFKIVYVLQDRTLERFKANKEVHFRLLNKLNENFDFYIINISNIIRENSVTIKNIDGFKYFAPKNTYELTKFFKQGKNLAMIKLPISINFHKIYRCLKINDVKLFSFSNLVFAYETTKEKNLILQNFFNSAKIFKKINYFFYRLFILFNLYPRISFHFESDERRIKTIKKSFIYKLQNIFSKLQLTFYDKVIRINSKYYSQTINRTEKAKEDCIVVCDTPISHPDITVLNGRIRNDLAEKYYKHLFDFLFYINKQFDKKIIFCAHPKGDYKDYKNFDLINKNFIVTYYETSYYIAKAKFVLFQTSNTINEAIILKKPILQFESNLLSNITKKKILDLNSELGCSKVNIENFKNINFEFFNKLVKETTNYENYTNSRLLFERNKKDLDQLIEYIKENIF